MKKVGPLTHMTVHGIFGGHATNNGCCEFALANLVESVMAVWELGG